MIELPTEANPISILVGDCLARLKEIPDKSVRCCVTSPPYWGLRDYGHDEQIGLEETPEEYVAKIVSIFREVRRVLTNDGTLWLNLGDSYCSIPGQGKADRRGPIGEKQMRNSGSGIDSVHAPGLKPKDLVGIPWMTAFALRADGWYLRQDIIWAKPNPMPESVEDRCTKSHEHIFLLSKSSRYYFDSEAIAEPLAASSKKRMAQNIEEQEGSHRVPGKTNGTMKAVTRKSGNKARKPASARGVPRKDRTTQNGNPIQTGFASQVSHSTNGNVAGSVPWQGDDRNKRDVWKIATRPFKEAHFATFPEQLVEPCILAGSAEGDIILDPFGGAGTVGVVAGKKWRRAILIELNPAYAEIARNRIAKSQGSGLIAWGQDSAAGNGSLPVVAGGVLKGKVQQLWPDDAEADSPCGDSGHLASLERPHSVNDPVEADERQEPLFPVDHD